MVVKNPVKSATIVQFLFRRGFQICFKYAYIHFPGQFSVKSILRSFTHACVPVCVCHCMQACVPYVCVCVCVCAWVYVCVCGRVCVYVCVVSIASDRPISKSCSALHTPLQPITDQVTSALRSIHHCQSAFRHRPRLHYHTILIYFSVPIGLYPLGAITLCVNTLFLEKSSPTNPNNIIY